MGSSALWPLILYFAIVLIVAVGMLALSWVLGERHHDHATGEPYESGIVSTGGARLRFEPQFYLVAMFFVIFDLEAMFLFAWAVAIHPGGWAGYADIAGFVAVLLVALVYLWRIGGLDVLRMGRSPRKAREALR